MRNFILKVISDWDLMGLANIAPKDEYLSEVIEIENILSANKNITAEELSKRIKDIFIKNFDCENFSFDVKDIKPIAEKILLNNHKK